MRHLFGSRPWSTGTLRLLLVLPILALLTFGCGSDDKPGPTQPGTDPPGLIVFGFGSPDSEETITVFVVVLYNDLPVADANVRIGGTVIPPMNVEGTTMYLASNIPGAIGETVTLQVTTTNGNRSMSARVVGPVEITSPDDEATFAANASIPVTWTGGANAGQFIVAYTEEDDDEESYIQSVSSANIAHTIPASATTSQTLADIVVYALNGTGMLPVGPSPNVPTSGFWIMTLDTVTIEIE